MLKRNCNAPSGLYTQHRMMCNLKNYLNYFFFFYFLIFFSSDAFYNNKRIF